MAATVRICAPSVLLSIRHKRETTTPLVDSSIHDRVVKACPLVDKTRFKFVDVSNSGSVNFLLQYTLDAIVDWVQIWWPQCWRNEVWHPFAPGKRRCHVFDAPGRRPVEKQKTLL